MKQFVKAFQYLPAKFNGLSDAKLKEGIFIEPDIRILMKDDNFDEKNEQK